MSDGPPPGESWIPVYDRMFKSDHHLADEPACRRWAWIDLCNMAAWKDTAVVYKGKAVELKRGQVVASLRKLAERWRWSKSRVRRFIELLEHDAIDKIRTVSETHAGTVYSVVSYDTYALGRDSNGPTKPDRGGTEAGQEVEVVDSVVREEPLSLRSREPSLAASLGIFLEKTGAEWAIKTPPEEWLQEIAREKKYVGADLAYEIRKAADWYSAQKEPPKRPDMSIRNWLERSAEQAREEAEKNRRTSREEHLRGLGISTGRL